MKTFFSIILKNKYAWSGLCIDLIAFFFTLSDKNNILNLVYLILLLIIMLCTSTYLIIINRKYFTNWISWSIPILLFYICNLINDSGIIIKQFNISLFIVLILFNSLIWIPVTSGIMLWYRDVGVKIIAWYSAIFIWSFVAAWKIHGNILEIWSSSSSGVLWWLNPIPFFGFMVIPLCIFSIIRFTYLIISEEFA